MHSFYFDKSLERFDQIISDMSDANKKNDLMLRHVCKQIFQKSFSKLESQQTLESGGHLAGIGVVSLIKKVKGTYKEGTFSKSFKKLTSQTDVFSYSDLKKINEFLNNCEIQQAIKLLRIQYDLGIKEALFEIS